MKKFSTLLLCCTSLVISDNAEGMKKPSKSQNLSTKTAMKPIIEQEQNLLNFSSLNSDSDSMNSDSSQPTADWQLKTVCTKSSLEFIRLQQDIKKAQEELEELQKKYDAQKKANEELLKEANEARDIAKSIEAEFEELSSTKRMLQSELDAINKLLPGKRKLWGEKYDEKQKKEKEIENLKERIENATQHLKANKITVLLRYMDDLAKCDFQIEEKDSGYTVKPSMDTFISSLEEENAQLRSELEKFKETDKKAITEIEEEIRAFDERKEALLKIVDVQMTQYDERIRKNESRISKLENQICNDNIFFTLLRTETLFFSEKSDSQTKDTILTNNNSGYETLGEMAELNQKKITENIALLRDEIDLFNQEKNEISVQKENIEKNAELLKVSLQRQIEQHRQNIARFSLPSITE